MLNVQNQLVTIVQDMQKKVNEMYADWKVNGFCGRTENDTKWFEVSWSVYYYKYYSFI